jgi:hypothetical protein
MPRKVSDLLGSWRGQLGNRNALNIWEVGFFLFDVVSLERAERKEL